MMYSSPISNLLPVLKEVKLRDGLLTVHCGHWAGVINTGCNFGVPPSPGLGTICPDGVKIVPAVSMHQVRTHTAARGPGIMWCQGSTTTTTTQSKYMTADQNIRTRYCQSLETINPVCMNIYEMTHHVDIFLMDIDQRRLQTGSE